MLQGKGQVVSSKMPNTPKRRAFRELSNSATNSPRGLAPPSPARPFKVLGDDEGIRFGSKSLFSVKAEDSAIERVELGGVPRSRGVGGSPSNTADESVTTRKCDNEAKLATQAGPLPDGWEMIRSPTGQYFFVNHKLKLKTWEDPRELQQGNKQRKEMCLQSGDAGDACVSALMHEEEAVLQAEGPFFPPGETTRPQLSDPPSSERMQSSSERMRCSSVVPQMQPPLSDLSSPSPLPPLYSASAESRPPASQESRPFAQKAKSVWRPRKQNQEKKNYFELQEQLREAVAAGVDLQTTWQQRLKHDLQDDPQQRLSPSSLSSPLSPLQIQTTWQQRLQHGLQRLPQQAVPESPAPAQAAGAAVSTLSSSLSPSVPAFSFCPPSPTPEAGREANAAVRSWKIRLRLPSDSAAAPQVVRHALRMPPHTLHAREDVHSSEMHGGGGVGGGVKLRGKIDACNTCNTCNTCSEMRGAGVGAGKESLQAVGAQQGAADAAKASDGGGVGAGQATQQLAAKQQASAAAKQQLDEDFCELVAARVTAATHAADMSSRQLQTQVQEARGEAVILRALLDSAALQTAQEQVFRYDFENARFRIAELSSMLQTLSEAHARRCLQTSGSPQTKQPQIPNTAATLGRRQGQGKGHMAGRQGQGKGAIWRPPRLSALACPQHPLAPPAAPAALATPASPATVDKELAAAHDEELAAFMSLPSVRGRTVGRIRAFNPLQPAIQPASSLPASVASAAGVAPAAPANPANPLPASTDPPPLDARESSRQERLLEEAYARIHALSFHVAQLQAEEERVIAMLTAKCAALEKELFREKELAAAARRAASPASACGFAAAVAASEPAVSDASRVMPDRSAPILEAVIKSGSDTDKEFSNKEDGGTAEAERDTPLWNLDGISPFCHHAAAGLLKTKQKLETKLGEAAPPASHAGGHRVELDECASSTGSNAPSRPGVQFDSVSSWMSAPLPFIAAKGAEEETAVQKNKKQEIAWGDASATFFLTQTCAVSSSSSSSMRGWANRKELPLTPRFQEEGISKLMPEGYSVWQQKKDAKEFKNEKLPHLNIGEVSGVPKHIKDELFFPEYYQGGTLIVL